MSILVNRQHEPDTIDVLLQAFRTVDTDNRGYIVADEFEELLKKKESAPFRNKEVTLRKFQNSHLFDD